MSFDGSPRAEETSVAGSPVASPRPAEARADAAGQPSDEALRATAALVYGDEYDNAYDHADAGAESAMDQSVASETGSRLNESYLDEYTSADDSSVATGGGSPKPKTKRRRRRRRRKVRRHRPSKDWHPVREDSASAKHLPRLSMSRRRVGSSSPTRARARRNGRASSFLSDRSRCSVSPRRQRQDNAAASTSGLLSHRSAAEDKPGKDSIYDGVHMADHPGPGQYTPAHPAWKDNRKVVMGMKLSETRSFIIEAARRAALTPGAGAHDPSVEPVKPRTQVHSFHKDKRRDIHEQHLRAISNVQGPNTRVRSQFGTNGVGVTRNGKKGHAGATFSRVKRF